MVSFQLNINKICVVILMITCAGCTSLVRRSANFDEALPHLKTIAVLPADVKVFKISAGGISEEIDEWSQEAKRYFESSLKKYLGDGSQYQLNLKFVTEEWLKENQKNNWRQQQAMYEAIVQSVIRHTYSAIEKFPQKLSNFDYTLGSEIGTFAQAMNADGFIFVHASDVQETGGRVAVNFVRAVILGYYEVHPSFFAISLVDGKTGDLLWFNVSSGQQDYNFLNPKHIDAIVQWVTKDFISPRK